MVNCTIKDIKLKFHSKLDIVDLELLISYVIKKEREFVLAHPEYLVTSNQQSAISKMIKRRMKNEPLAYILGEKEFYGLNFKVNKHTLIPRPESELMVEMAREEIFNAQCSIFNVIDVGTGSGNIIVSLAHQLKTTSYKLQATNYFAVDISKDALIIAKQNAKLHNLNKKIKFLHGNLLEPFLKKLPITSYKLPVTRLVVLANLPYLSKEIYNACADNVKKYEPKSALYSPNSGLSHYDKLLNQLKKLQAKNYKLRTIIFMEISPEQKKLIPSIIKKHLPEAKIEFKKDLAQKWRVCKVEI